MKQQTNKTNTQVIRIGKNYSGRLSGDDLRIFTKAYKDYIRTQVNNDQDFMSKSRFAFDLFKKHVLPKLIAEEAVAV